METTLSRLQVWPLWQKAKRFTISTVHEDAATGARAEEFCQMLAKSLVRTPEISKELWLLPELRTPQLRAIAAQEAAAADLVIISVHHAESLPREVDRWIDLWLKQKGRRPTVLLALFDALYLGTSSPMQTVLEGVARKGNLEFLACAEEKLEE